MTTRIKMSEAQLQDAVAELAQTLGFLVFHTRPAMNKDGSWVTPIKYDGKGYPDLTIVGHGHVLFIEMKSARGKVSPEQEVWLKKMTMTGVYTDVWRPDHWTSGLIQSVLEDMKEHPWKM